MVVTKLLVLTTLVVLAALLNVPDVQAAKEIEGFTYLGQSVPSSSEIGVQAVGNYYLSQSMGTWDVAESTCGSLNKMGSRLLAIEDIYEDEHVKSLLISAGITSVWTSGYIEGATLKWYSSRYTTIGYYNNFRDNVVPQVPIGYSYSVFISANGARNYFWDIYPDYQMLQYVCETPAD